ncbi:MAG: alpha/beta hydrolase [Sphingomonas bacterium]|nr:alpha/beta hydrolase [Sphingomonas bacterium]
MTIALAPTPAPDADLSYLDPGDGRRIAIRHRAAGAGLPTILFLPGYASDMAGAKAVAIDQFCAHRNLGCLRIDYSGTGSSPGQFADGTLDRWLDEVLAAIDLGVADGKLIVAGSSMGAWIALHAALRRPARVAAVLGIAAAPDFTDWGFTAAEKDTLAATGRLERANPDGPEPSVTHHGFWQSGAAYRLLHSPIDLTIPIRLVHGELDDVVSMGVPIKLMADLRSSDVQLRLIKNGGHRLSAPHEIHAILVELHGLIERVVQ